MTRWISASIYKYFSDAVSPLRVYVENENIDMASLAQWAEIRLTGPRYKEVSNRYYNIEIDINLMCVVKPSDDIYALERIVGQFQQAMGVIHVFKYGNNASTDDQSEIGCLILRPDAARPIDTIPWGEISADIPTRQTGIDAYYWMDFLV